jgi:hypothetical protein
MASSKNRRNIGNMRSSESIWRLVINNMSNSDNTRNSVSMASIENRRNIDNMKNSESMESNQNHIAQ